MTHEYVSSRVITSSHRHPEQAATQHKGGCYSCSDFILVKREKKSEMLADQLTLSVCTQVNNPWKITPAGTQLHLRGKEQRSNV